MNDFFESKFIKDLQAGKLPEVEVTVTDDTLLKIFGGLTASVILMIITAALVKKFL